MVKKVSVRLMAPFSMHCTSCSHFIYKSTKFNARKTNSGDQYLGIAIVQFSFRCPSCGNEIRIRTDPKTSGYVVLSGADRNLDPWHDKDAENESVDEKLTRLTQVTDAGRGDTGVESDSKVEAGGNLGRQNLDAAAAPTIVSVAPQSDTLPITTTPQRTKVHKTPPPIGITKLPQPKRRKGLLKHP